MLQALPDDADVNSDNGGSSGKKKRRKRDILKRALGLGRTKAARSERDDAANNNEPFKLDADAWMSGVDSSLVQPPATPLPDVTIPEIMPSSNSGSTTDDESNIFQKQGHFTDTEVLPPPAPLPDETMPEIMPSSNSNSNTDDENDDFQKQGQITDAEAGAGATTNSKASARFDAMLAQFRKHSNADLNLVTSPRSRGLLTGTSAAINDAQVTRAFKVLYEDLGPIRVAGDLMFSKLEREVAVSMASDGAGNVRALGRDEACVVAARKIFDAVDADDSGTVSTGELLDSDLLRSLGQCADCTCEKKGSCQSVANFMAEIDKTHPEGEIHFDEFLVAAHHLLYEGDASLSLFGGENADDLVDQLLDGINSSIPMEKNKVDRYSKRFDAMCEEFETWESDDASSSKAEERNPRLALVLEGCFAGAKQQPIVDALKILYVDFGVLRMAGDLIFKMMRKLAR